MIELNKIYNEDCLIGMQRIEDASIDVILTDPPYLYLKNQKLDRPFDERQFFSECKRTLKDSGFIVLFGRGTSFYRWNTILADLGFAFKEEIIWNKSYCSSPLMNISRVHETISIFTKKNGTINKAKVPYLEMKGHDVDAICIDLRRFLSGVKNIKSLNAVLDFLENNCYGENIIRTDYIATSRPNSVACEKNKPTGDRSVNVIQSISFGLNEKSIIRTDRYDSGVFTKYNVN
ncbi:MAG: site-specific DNA-methyltransferase, partial [Bacteroidales bacterium]|nr:site-specific DNA-methyltransferase [Bacteroidales bacterium]